MAGNLTYQHKRSTVANKRPTSGLLQVGEIAINNNNAQPALFFKTNTNTIIKVAPAHISPSAPPFGAGGHTTYTPGEFWFDTGNNVLKVYDSSVSAWKNCFQGVNISSTEEPPEDPLDGDMWYKPSTAELYIYVGPPTEAFVNVGPGGSGGNGAFVDDDAPIAPFTGDFWFEDDVNTLRMWDGSTWVTITGGGVGGAVSDDPYGVGWDGMTLIAPSQNAVYDKINNLESVTIPGKVSDTSYGVGWDGVTTIAPSKNAVYDKINNLESVIIPAKVSDTAYATSWNGVTSVAPSQNAVFDAIEEHRPIGTMNGRLTLTSGSPVITGIQSGNTIYYTPYNGNTVYLYDPSGTRWVRHTLSEISTNASGFATDTPNDLFLYNNSGTLTLEAVPWTNRTTRATSLSFQNGIVIKTGDASRRYLGTASRNSSAIWQCLSVDLNANTEVHNTLFNHYNPIEGKIKNSFLLTTTASGTNLWYSNAYHRIMYAYFSPISVKMMCAANFGNATGLTQHGISIAYEGFSTYSLSSSGATMPNSTFFDACASTVGVNSSLGLFSMEARVNTTSASITSSSSEHLITYPC